MKENIEAGLEAMLEHMRDDYRAWSRSGEKDEYGSVAFPSYIVEQSTGQAQLNIIQSCGHMPHKTHTKQVLLAIDDFINDLS